jgi:signal transduction histidine kinase
VSQSSPAKATPSGLLAARRAADSALAPRNWRVASRLVILVAIPAALGLTLAGLQVSDATSRAAAYGQVGRLAALGQQVTGLAQAMEHERGETAALIANGHPAAGLAVLQRQYVITDGRAATVRRLVLRLGRGYPARTRAATATAMTSIAELPGLRRRATQSQAPELAVINGYSAAIAGLFPVIDGIADRSSNSVLITSVRALGSLSRMKDQAAQQQAVLGASLAAGHFAPGALNVLTVAQAQEASDLASFRSSATRQESWALTDTLAGPQAGLARAVEQRATAAGPGALSLGAQASQQWQAGMSYTVGWMRHAEQQLAGWVTAYARSLRQSAMRSAIITGGAALAVLVLALLATLIIARSVVRPLRRLEAAALDVAGARLPAEVRALTTGGTSGLPVPVTSIDVLATDEIGQVARAVDQVHREAVRLAGEEARQRGSVSAIFASSFQRSYSLMERLLSLIDSMELCEDDPERLANLFQLDHLATRMRRNSERALVLAGHEIPRHETEPVTLVDVLRAASSEIEQYDRVTLNVQLEVSVVGSAATDTVHLLAELLENGTTFSPKTTQVILSADTSRSGDLVISMTDAGPGMSEEQLRWLNWQLAHPPLADGTVARHLGMFAVAHLAARHGISVALRLPPGGGTTAEVRLPAALISHDATPGRAGTALGASAAGGPGAAATAGPRPPALRFSGPEKIPAGPTLPAGPAGAVSDALPPRAPVHSAAPATSIAATGPEPGRAEPDGALPIFASVESEYLQARGSGLVQPGEPQAGQPAAGQPATAAGTATAGGRTTAGLPQRIQPAPPVPGSAAAGETPHAPMAESVQIAQSRLARFQRGSRRARADCDATQPAQDR